MPISLSGSLNLSGSLTTTGTITATTLVVQTITSSISSITGSTNFGSIVTDTHKFTGSLNVTGSLSVVTTGTEFQVTSTGVNLGNALIDSHIISGSLTVNPSGLFVSSSGNVGINTTSPSSKLHVVGSSLTDTFRITDASNYTIVMGYSGSANVGMISTLGGTAKLALGTNSAARLTIDGNGNVGIGTSSPAYPLDVQTLSGNTYLNIGRASQTTGQVALQLSGGTSGVNWIIYQGSNSNDLSFYGNGATRMTITSAGVVDLPYGQIKFPATQNPSSDANTLDDYEEGTWTPTAIYSTSNGDRGYTYQVGRYVKVGKLVTCVAYLLFSETTASGNLSIGGLPFTSANLSNLIAGFGVFTDNLTGTSGGVQGQVIDNTSTIGLVYNGTGTSTSITNANTAGNAVFRMSFSYITEN
jgi:hypothetical protein